MDIRDIGAQLFAQGHQPCCLAYLSFDEVSGLSWSGKPRTHRYPVAHTLSLLKSDDWFNLEGRGLHSVPDCLDSTLFCSPDGDVCIVFGPSGSEPPWLSWCQAAGSDSEFSRWKRMLSHYGHRLKIGVVSERGLVLDSKWPSQFLATLI